MLFTVLGEELWLLQKARLKVGKNVGLKKNEKWEHFSTFGLAIFSNVSVASEIVMPAFDILIKGGTNRQSRSNANIE